MSKWQTVKLSDMFTLQMGKTPSRDNPAYWNGTHKWVSIADLGKAAKFIVDTKECITDLAVSETGIKATPKDTIVMSFKLSIGKTAVTAEEIYTNEAIMSFIDKGIYDFDVDYIYHLFSSKDWSEGTNKAVMGITLNKATLSQVSIPLPPIVEQRKIAYNLGKVTYLIDLCNAILEKLDLLVKSRFVEMFGTLESPASNFEYDTLKNLCYKITDGKHGGCTFEEGTSFYFVGAREIYDDTVHYETAPEITEEEFYKDYKRCNVEVGDFLIVNTGATIGKSAIATDDRTEHTLLQKSVALMKTKKDKLLPIFLMYCYKVNDRMYKVESASAQPNLLLSKINATKIYVPSLALQQQFAAFVEQTDKSKLAVKKVLEKAETLKKALMQEYFG